MMGKYKNLANEIGELVDEKNAAYGNSFGEVGDFLKILYPNGISPDQYTDALCVVRIFDKLKRIASNKGAFGESPYRDIVGYGLLGLEKDTRVQQKIEALKEYMKENVPTSTITLPEENLGGKVLDIYEEEPRSAGTPTWRPTGTRTSLDDKEEKEAKDPQALVPIECSICLQNITWVNASELEKHGLARFVHEDCYKAKKAAEK